MRNLKSKLSESAAHSNKSKSLEGKTNKKDNVSVSIRYLLNSLQTKGGMNKNLSPFDIIDRQNEESPRKSMQPESFFNGLINSSYKNIDKDKIFRIYEEEQMKIIRKKESN